MSEERTRRSLFGLQKEGDEMAPCPVCQGNRFTIQTCNGCGGKGYHEQNCGGCGGRGFTEEAPGKGYRPHSPCSSSGKVRTICSSCHGAKTVRVTCYRSH